MTVFIMRSGVFYNIVSELRLDVLADAGIGLSRSICQLRAGNGYLAVTYRRPDGLLHSEAFGEQAQTVASAPKILTVSLKPATEDKRVTGEGIIIQHVLYLFSPVR